MSEQLFAYCSESCKNKTGGISPPGTFLFSSSHENALTLCFHAIPDVKSLRTCAGITPKRIAIFQIRSPRFKSLFYACRYRKNRCTLLRDMLQPDRFHS